MHVDRRKMVALGGGFLIAGCESMGGGGAAAFAPAPPLRPLKLTRDRLMRVTVCTRPFRASGPRLNAETVDGKHIIHNYGHGGSGWSLAWGCADDAAALAIKRGEGGEVAVVGAGVMGLTTALRLAESGLRATIYAKEFPLESRSARATGVWSPSSRIALAGEIEAGFEAKWERWARASYAAHQRRIGALGDPVEFLPHHVLADEDGPQPVPPRRKFLHLDRRLRGLTPPWRDAPAGDHPFPVDRVRRGLTMVFNVGRYAEALTQEFLSRGGRMVRKAFPERSAILGFGEQVIVNCTGYGARALFGDDSLAPVRGQINWFAPQSEARYGVFHRQALAISRRDGVVVQYLGDNDDFGFGDETETPDPAETDKALKRLAPLFA